MPTPRKEQVSKNTDGYYHYVYGLGLIGEQSAGNYFSYHFDYRGSTVAITDTTGQIIDTVQYSPFGVVLSQPTFDTPFLFNGLYGVMTDDNGLSYMRARYYSADIRRFVNQDILLGNVADGQSLNRFAFVTGNPVSFVDPFGLSEKDVIAIIELITNHKNTSDIKIGNYEFIEMPEGKIARHSRWSGNILLNNKYLEPICDIKSFNDLVEDILHEAKHNTDGFFTESWDVFFQPELTENHASIYARVNWELGRPVLEPNFPEGQDYLTYDGNREDIVYSSPKIWGKEHFTQKGSPNNPSSMVPDINKLYDSLYPEGCGCENK